MGLIERTRLRSDKQAFATLVRLHQGKLRAFLLRLTRRHDLADDLAQETFIQAYRKLPEFAGHAGQFKSWLFSIAYREFLQQRRRDDRYQEVITDLGDELRIEPGRFEQLSAEQLDLEQALSKLGQAERAAISLCHSYGFSHAEAAVILELPVGTVKSQILRGKQKLRDLLAVDTALASTATGGNS